MWFTDPTYRGQLYEGEPDGAGGASNPNGKLNPWLGQPAGFVPGKREPPANCYRIDPTGTINLMIAENLVTDPNGLCFFPDDTRLNVVSMGKGPGDTGPGGKGDVPVFDVGADNKPNNHRAFPDCVINGVRCDVHGNLWVSSNAARNLGFGGVIPTP